MVFFMQSISKEKIAPRLLSSSSLMNVFHVDMGYRLTELTMHFHIIMHWTESLKLAVKVAQLHAEKVKF